MLLRYFNESNGKCVGVISLERSKASKGETVRLGMGNFGECVCRVTAATEVYRGEGSGDCQQAFVSVNYGRGAVSRVKTYDDYLELLLCVPLDSLIGMVDRYMRINGEGGIELLSDSEGHTAGYFIERNGTYEHLKRDVKLSLIESDVISEMYDTMQWASREYELGERLDDVLNEMFG